jgi:hypothetical protein
VRSGMIDAGQSEVDGNEELEHCEIYHGICFTQIERIKNSITPSSSKKKTEYHDDSYREANF